MGRPCFISQRLLCAAAYCSATSQVGYLLSLLCLSALGYWMLFWVVDSFRIKVAHRILIFSAYVIFFQELSLGVNGVLLALCIALRRDPATTQVVITNCRFARTGSGRQTICGRPLMCLGRAVPIGGTRNCLPGSPIGLLRASCGLCWKIMAVRTAGNRGVAPLWWLAFPESLEMVLGVTKGAVTSLSSPACSCSCSF